MTGQRAARRAWAALALLILLGACKSRASTEAQSVPDLRVEILDLDTSFAPRGQRPFIAGEKARLSLRIEGGTPPYELQMLTSKGDPRLASGSTTVEAQSNAAELALELELASEVSSGSYGLAVRVSDQGGRGAVTRSAAFEVIGKDAPTASPEANPLGLRVVDAAGRSRQSFYQGEEIRIRATLVETETIAIGILAEDNRPFMPMRRYQPEHPQIDIGLRVPRLARIGQYRVEMASQDAEAAQNLRIVGQSWPPAASLGLADLDLRGGQDLRSPRAALLLRGETIALEALAAGVKLEARAQLRVRDRASKIVASEELPAVVPADPHPESRAFVAGSWTLPESLPAGRYTLELEISEGDDVATLYREVQIN